MTDYRRFLGRSTTEVLPYFGGAWIEAGDRRLRIARRVDAGFWRCAVTGRDAQPIERVASPDLSALPPVRGHLCNEYLVQPGGRAEEFALGPSDDPPRFSPATSRRWPTGDVVFEGLDFESGVEESVRERFEDCQPIHDVKGVPSSLRAAFGYAVTLRVAAERRVTVALIEVRGAVGRIADGGDAVANDAIDGILRERARQAAVSLVQPSTRARPVPADVEERVDFALIAAGATPLASRHVGGGLLEVRYRFEGERFVSIVDAATLQVVDAGICLDGEDELVTLESLPGVIREAIRTGHVVVTGR